jgi:formylglycine-generating enzyme required for sulfatase activity
MKNWKQKFTVMAIAAVTALALSACFSPWKGDTGTFSISTGGSGGGRTIWNGINTDTLEHVITLEGPGPEQTATVTGAGTVQFSVVPGVWNIAIEGRLNGELVAEGSRTVVIKTGSNGAITISMREPTKNTLIEMVRVQGGSFQMGQNGNGNSNNVTPVHTVTLTGFYIGKYEVTQAQYQTVMGTNPSSHTTGADEGEVQEKRPVENVSWYDALVFCNKLSMSEGLSPAYSIGGSTDPSAWGTVPTTTSSVTPWNAVVMVAGSNGYRLPTEAQWEYAAKGGPSASSPYKIYSGSDDIDDVAWHSGSKTHEAGKLYRNELGIYDMSGNVWEWCWDWYDENYYSSSPQTDPPGAPSGSLRVQRGGGYNDDYSTGYFRSAYRKGYYGPYINLGFRVVLPASMGQPSEPPVEPPEEPGMEGFVCANAAQWNEALAEIRDGGSNKTYTINVTGGFDLPGYTAGNTFGSAENINVIIRGNYTIKLDGSGSLLSIGAGQTVTIRDLKLQGRGNDFNNSAPLVLVEGGTFTMEGSASITGNTNNNSTGNSYGGGVAVHGGTFTMSGGSIAGNNASSSAPNAQPQGGGVYVSGTFNMSGGTIGGDEGGANTATKGGGVAVSNDSTFNMTGGSISGNEASLGVGGGVYVSDHSTFFMSNGSISGNEASLGAGGGVYVLNSTFFMSVSAVISRNISDTMGGGVYLQDGEFTMSVGAVISGNKATGNTSNGGGVYVSGASSRFEMTGGTIGGDEEGDANTAYIGGGVVVYEGSTFDMSGGEISGNKSSATGGGVVINSSEFTMRGSAVISGNAVIGTNTTGVGGGVAVQYGTFNMIDGKINGNTVTGAPSNGGGVYVNSGTFRIVNGTVYGNAEVVTALQNTATNGAALFVNGGTAQRGTFSVPGDITSEWNSAGTLSTTNDTIKVTSGVLQ